MKGLKRRRVKRVWMVISDAHRGHSGSGEKGVVKDGVAETPGPLSRTLYWLLFILSNKLSTELIRMSISKLISWARG